MPSSLIWGRHLIAGADGNGDARVVPQGAVFQRNGEIVEVGPADDLRARHSPDEEIGSTDHLVLPGLINAHHHVGLSPFQLGTPDDALEPWITDRIGKRGADPYLDTLWGAACMIEAGITSVMHNDTSVVGPQPLEDAQRVLQAYEEAGMRVAFSVFYRERNRLVYDDDEAFLTTLPDDLATPLRDDLAASAMSSDTYLTLFRDLTEQYRGAGRVRILLAPGNVQWCSDDFLCRVKERAQQVGTGIHIHLLESPYQKSYGLRTWGLTPVQHLDQLGFLGPEVSCAHSVWLSDGDLEALARTGTTVCHNPSSNLRLRSGIAPVNRMRAAGVPLALGIDEATINDDQDLLQEMRLAAKLHREPGVGSPALDSAQILHMATVAGARALGFGREIGVLAPGKRADVVLLDLRHIEEPHLDPAVDIVDALLYRGRGADVDTVLVDGQVLLRGGRLTTIDRAALVESLRADLGREDTPAERDRRPRWEALVPHVRAFYAGWDVGDPAAGPHYRLNER